MSAVLTFIGAALIGVAIFLGIVALAVYRWNENNNDSNAKW
jgi:nitrogen fixation-related uncharacterized protein